MVSVLLRVCRVLFAALLLTLLARPGMSASTSPPAPSYVFDAPVNASLPATIRQVTNRTGLSHILGTQTQQGGRSGAIAQGVLTANLRAASGWDTVDTLAVSVAESGGILTGTSVAGAQAGATLAMVDSELPAYENATLTGSDSYNLTDLARGIDGSTGAAHSTGAQFFSLISGFLSYSFSSSYVGVELYFKFQSYNWVGTLEDLSTCAVYTCTPTGVGTIGPITTALAAGASLNLGSASAVTISESLGNASGPVTITVNLGNAS